MKMAKNWISILVVAFCLAQVALACIPTCRQLGLSEPPSGYGLPGGTGVTKYCWIYYSGNSYSQMSGSSVQHTTWTGSLVEVTVPANSNQDIIIQINPLLGSATSQGNPGKTGAITGITGMNWPQNGAVVPLGFVYSGDGTTLEAGIDMTGTNYAIDDATLNVQWCSRQGNSFQAMGQSWSGYGMARKYRAAGTNVYAAGGCSSSSDFALNNYRIPIIRVLGGDGSGKVLAQSEAQWGTSADQNWWFVTQHRLLFIKQRWVDATSSVSYRLDPSVKGPPDAAPASSTVWTGAQVAIPGGFALTPPQDWNCDNAPANTMWSMMCKGGFLPVYWDNVDNNGVAIRVPTFQIPVGSCLDTNFGQQAPAMIDLNGSGFRLSSSFSFVSSYNDASTTPFSTTCNTVNLLATRINGNGNWAWTGPSGDIFAVRQGLAAIPLDLN